MEIMKNLRRKVSQFAALAGFAFALASPLAATDLTDPLDPIYLPRIAESAAAYPKNVWVTDAMAKVHTNDPPGTQHVVKISAARNEFESFQIHVQAAASTIQFGITVTDFVNSKTGDRIPASTNVFVSREAYLNVTHLSDLNGRLGVTPDPLVPAVDPYFHEARNAFPEAIPPSETRSAWVDVLVPANAPSGYYVASAIVTDGATVLAKLPVRLKVWNFAIPSTASLHTAFGVSWNGMCVQAYGSYYNCSQYPGSGGSNDGGVEQTHIAETTFALDHRVSLSDVVYYGPPTGTWQHFDGLYGPLLNGSASSLLSGAALTNMRFTVSNRLKAKTIQDWVGHFTANGWLDRLFDYTCDEPPAGCSWSKAYSDSKTIHSGSPDMKTEITTDIDSATKHNLLDVLNILSPVVDHMEPRGLPNQRSNYDGWLAGSNKHLWWYQSCDEHESCSNGTPGGSESTWPSYMVDATPVRNRVFQWLAFLDRIETELYYQADYCWEAKCDGSTDPWLTIYAFGGNGDGTLIYPGTPAKIGGTTPVPVSSIRFNLIRDGMEDYEYLNALANAGQRTFAEQAAHSFITNALTFNNNPAALSKAREQLGNQLHQLGRAGKLNQR
jgi:Domain of unknown function (DUF4091)